MLQDVLLLPLLNVLVNIFALIFIDYFICYVDFINVISGFLFPIVLIYLVKVISFVLFEWVLWYIFLILLWDWIDVMLIMANEKNSHSVLEASQY